MRAGRRWWMRMSIICCTWRRRHKAKEHLMCRCIFTMVISICLAAANTLAAEPAAATLTGKVTDSAGKPIPAATVMIFYAGVKKGYSTYCPSCYADCGKRALSDADGAFVIKDLSADLWFTLLVVR